MKLVCFSCSSARGEELAPTRECRRRRHSIISRRRWHELQPKYAFVFPRGVHGLRKTQTRGAPSPRR